MATLYQTDVILKRRPAPAACGSETISVRAVFPVKTALAVGDIIEFLTLPADHVPVDCLVDADDLDSGATPALAYDVGIMSGAVGLMDVNRSVGAQFFSAATVGQTAGMARTGLRSALCLMPRGVDRSVGLKVTTAAATAVISSTAANNNRGVWQPSTIYAVNDYVTLPNGLRVRVTTAGTSGVVYPEAFDTTLFGATVTDGGVTWTMADPYIALTLVYRAAHNGL
jgi:hypothetical protein